MDYATTKNELHAIVYKLEIFHSYILGSHVAVFTDHSVLNYLLLKRISSHT